jgi:PAS domain S-box-containing protein
MERLFQALSKTDGALVIDQEQRIIYWNQAAEEILGYSPQKVSGQPCYTILAGRDDRGQLVCQKHCRLAMKALGRTTVTNCDISVRAKSGDVRWINMSTFTFPLNGSRAGSVLVHLFRDVTSKKQLEQFTNRVLAAARQLGTEELSQAAGSDPVEQPATDLTEREREVLTLLARGLTTGNMARSLSISPATVRNHIRNILQKLQVHNRLEAVLYAQQHGLIATAKK